MLTGWRGDVLALLAGMLLPLAYAPLSWWPLALLSLAVLFAIWLLSSARRAAWRGWLFGLGCFGAGISWVFISIYYHGHVPLPLAITLTVMLVMYMAAFPALCGYLYARFFGGGFSANVTRLKLLLVLPALWVLIEWLRGWLFTGFPWLAVGYSQVAAPLDGIAPLLGVYGVSWAVALTAALLVAVLLDANARRWAVAGVIGLWLSAWALGEVVWTDKTGEPIDVALLQGNIPQNIKWHPSMRLPTIDLYGNMTRDNWDADLIIWPESAFPAFYHEAELYLEDLSLEAREHETDLLIGILFQDLDSGRYYNTMLSLGQDQRMYHKDHLVPFTEYLPLKSLLGGLVEFMRVPMSDFSKGGPHQGPLPAAGQWAGMSICFEDAFGEEVIRALPKATFLVNVSNDAWFNDSWAPPQHLQMAQMRAIETGRPMLRTTNTGISAVFDFDGREIARAPQFEDYALRATVQPRDGMTPYAYFANIPVVVLTLASVLWLGWRLRAQTIRPD